MQIESEQIIPGVKALWWLSRCVPESKEMKGPPPSNCGRQIHFNVSNAPFLFQQSSVCRAGLHAGVIDNDGGWMDVTRQGRKDFFIKSNKNGVQSLG